MCWLPARSSKLRVASAENFGSSASIAIKNPSWVTFLNRALEQRMMQSRQPVQDQHADQRTERASRMVSS